MHARLELLPHSGGRHVCHLEHSLVPRCGRFPCIQPQARTDLLSVARDAFCLLSYVMYGESRKSCCVFVFLLSCFPHLTPFLRHSEFLCIITPTTFPLVVE